ncbi:MAG TPA: dihydrodipicolinate synthase family protein [Arthrobacter sp.]|nr:dihydrodipicolinate synthase family protein [Arthrobacter sp.]
MDRDILSAIPRSTFVISLTPFTHNGELDRESLQAHFERLRDSGIGVYVGGGGSGEAHALALDEIVEIAECAVATLKGHVPVRAMGREPRTSAAMVEWANRVCTTGVDALQIYSIDPGHGYRPTERELETYFRDILEAVDFPSVVSTHEYNGFLLPVSLIECLLQSYGQIIGINCTSSNIRYLSEIISVCHGRAEVHVGGPTHALTAMALGANGFLSSEANIAPELAGAIIENYVSGDIGALSSAYRKFMTLHHMNSQYGSITAVKASLSILKLPGGTTTRRPRLPLQPEQRAAVEEILADVGLQP